MTLTDQPLPAPARSGVAPTGFTIRPQSPTIGAEISGIDLGVDLSAEVIDDLRTALLDWNGSGDNHAFVTHGVLCGSCRGCRQQCEPGTFCQARPLLLQLLTSQDDGSRGRFHSLDGQRHERVFQVSRPAGATVVSLLANVPIRRQGR